jgi:hypothetical protein
MHKGFALKQSFLLLVLSVVLVGFVSAQSTLNVNWADSRYGNVSTTILSGTLIGGGNGGGGCGPTSCSQGYILSFNTTGSVRLQATAYSNGLFVGWSGACSGTNSFCVVNVTTNNTLVYATFIARNNTNSTNQTHLACVNNACVSVNGVGNNTCTTNAQCSHLACVNRTCSLVPGPGRAECASKDARCGIVKNQTNMTIEPYAKVALSPSCGFWRRLFRLC